MRLTGGGAKAVAATLSRRCSVLVVVKEDEGLILRDLPPLGLLLLLADGRMPDERDHAVDVVLADEVEARHVRLGFQRGDDVVEVLIVDVVPWAAHLQLRLCRARGGRGRRGHCARGGRGRRGRRARRGRHRRATESGLVPGGLAAVVRWRRPPTVVEVPVGDADACAVGGLPVGLGPLAAAAAVVRDGERGALRGRAGAGADGEFVFEAFD